MCSILILALHKGTRPCNALVSLGSDRDCHQTDQSVTVLSVVVSAFWCCEWFGLVIFGEYVFYLRLLI